MLAPLTDYYGIPAIEIAKNEEILKIFINYIKSKAEAIHETSQEVLNSSFYFIKFLNLKKNLNCTYSYLKNYFFFLIDK